MKRINIGAGPDFKEGWVNTDSRYDPEYHDRMVIWDIRAGAFAQHIGVFDFALVSHTLCLLSYDEVDEALLNIKEVLKDGGVLQIIDMDTLQAFDNMRAEEVDGFPGHEGSIEEKMCKHLVGYGRKSIYTRNTMADKLKKAGFKSVRILKKSEHDLRPKESLIVEGTK